MLERWLVKIRIWSEQVVTWYAHGKVAWCARSRSRSKKMCNGNGFHCQHCNEKISKTLYYKHLSNTWIPRDVQSTSTASVSWPLADAEFHIFRWRIKGSVLDCRFTSGSKCHFHICAFKYHAFSSGDNSDESLEDTNHWKIPTRVDDFNMDISEVGVL